MKNWDELEECGVCKYWQDVGGIMSDQGSCHRYPSGPILKLHFHWCGEFELYSDEAQARRAEAEQRYEKRRAKTPLDEPPEPLQS